MSVRDLAGLGPELAAAIGVSNVLTDPAETSVYEFDGIAWGKRPDVVVFPQSAEDVQAIMRIAAHRNLPVTPRGAGTGLSGGAIAAEGGIVVVMTRMNHILSIDTENLVAEVQSGVVNLHLSQEIAKFGLFYAPDPSSQKSCTLGGNVAENAGGPHCLAYGVTTNHVLQLEVVLADGEIVLLGGLSAETPGYDLRGVFVGSEGTLGICTRAWLRLTPIPPAVRTMVAAFRSTEDACHAVSAIIAAGFRPAALEVIDRITTMAVNAAMNAGYPDEAGAVLLVEVDGTVEQTAHEVTTIISLCEMCGATTIRSAETDAEREALWAGRKGALAALGRVAPNYVLQDAVVPRSQLAAVLHDIMTVAAKHRVSIANVFHAGDGNLHPFLFYDPNDPDALNRVRICETLLMRRCIDAGGTISGEHGIGTDKAKYMAWVFSERDLAFIEEVRSVWNPTGLLNPGKILPLGEYSGTTRSLAGYV